jgi:hypothetical protein
VTRCATSWILACVGAAAPRSRGWKTLRRQGAPESPWPQDWLSVAWSLQAEGTEHGGPRDGLRRECDGGVSVARGGGSGATCICAIAHILPVDLPRLTESTLPPSPDGTVPGGCVRWLCQVSCRCHAVEIRREGWLDGRCGCRWHRPCARDRGNLWRRRPEQGGPFGRLPSC